MVVLQHAASETPAAVPITVRAGVKVVCFHDPLHCAAGRRFQVDLFVLTHYAGVTAAGLCGDLHGSGCGSIPPFVGAHLLWSEALEFLSEPNQERVVRDDRDDVFQIGADRLVELDQAGLLVLAQKDRFPVNALAQPLVFGFEPFGLANQLVLSATARAETGMAGWHVPSR